MNSIVPQSIPSNDSVVVYRTEDDTLQLNVQVADETVWLTQQQMADLFDTTKQNVSLHINNIFREGELIKNSVVKDSLTTAADGKNYLSSLLALVSGEKQCAKFAFLLFAICEGFLILLRF